MKTKKKGIKNMQGYFSYTFKGTREEIENIKYKMRELGKTNKNIEFLLDLESEVQINPFVEEGNPFECSLTYGVPESCNINCVPFLFEEMMEELTTLFVETFIEGTGYLLDAEPYPFWKKEKDENYYETTYEPISVYLSMEEYDEENDVFYVDLDSLCVEIEIPGNALKDKKGKWITQEIYWNDDETGIELLLILMLDDM